MRRLGVGLVASCVLLAGCTPASTGAARRAADGFQELIRTSDWAGACDLLSQNARQQLESAAARPCVQALPALRLSGDDVGSIEVWGRNAHADAGSVSMFLSRFTGGWRVIAAGCTFRAKDRPDDCTVGG